MYINKDPYGEIVVPNLTRIWNEVNVIGNKVVFYKEELPQYINDLKMYILYYIKDIKGIMSIFENDKNKMTLQVVKLARWMITFGFYKTKDELREISIALITLLNGSNDIYELLQEKLARENRFGSMKRSIRIDDTNQNVKRYEKNEDNLIIMKCKQYIWETLLKILDLEYDLKISLFLGFLKEEIESYYSMDNSPLDQEFANHAATSKVFPQDNIKKRSTADNDEYKNRLLYIPQPKEKVSFEENSAIIWMEKVLMGEQLFDGYSQTTYVWVLMDLIAYQHLPLSNKAFELLTKFFTQRSNLLELLKQIQLLEHPESIQTLNKWIDVLQRLRKFIEAIDTWLNEETLKLNSNDIAVGLVSSRESVDYLWQILIDRKQIKKQGTLKSNNDSNYEIIHGFKNNSGDLVIIDEEGNVLRKSEYSNNLIISNNENQRLLRNLGAHEIIIEIIKYNISQKKTHSDYEDIIKSAYIFLIRFWKDNSVNQGLVGEYLDIFIKELNSNPLWIFLIREIFKDNKFYLSIRGPKVVKHIVKKEESIPITLPEKYHYLNTLKTFARCKSKIVKKNQNEILINVSNDDNENIWSYFNTKDGISKIKGIIEKLSKAKHDQKGDIAEIEFPIELYNLITFLDLICVCCEGKNEFAELKAQSSVWKIKDILQLLQASDQFIPFKFSLVMYLYHAWLIVGNNEVFSEEENEDTLWKIVIILVKDLEDKNNEDSNDDSKIIYGPPYNQSLKQISDSYIYTAVISALCSTIKLALNYHEKDDIITRIITTTWELYYKADSNELKKPAFDLISYSYNSSTFSKYLENLRHPILSGDEPNSDDDEDTEIGKNKSKSKYNSRRATQVVGIAERTKASIFAHKINSITKYEEMEELLEKEFEELIKWYAEFSEIWDPEFQGFDPITHLFNLLDPENTSLSIDLQITGLKIIRKIVETWNDQMVTPAADWDNEDWEHCMAKIDIRQDYLVTKGCIHFLCNYLIRRCLVP